MKQQNTVTRKNIAKAQEAIQTGDTESLERAMHSFNPSSHQLDVDAPCGP